MNFATRSIVAALSMLTVSAGCDNPHSPRVDPERFYGRWSKNSFGIPPVTVLIRSEAGAATGQVWLSGVTYTLPATFTDSSVVLANPVLSSRAPFVGVLLKNGSMRVTLSGEPDHVDTLTKFSNQ